MKILRAIGCGILLWILIFFEVSILIFGLKLPQTTITYYSTHFIFLLLFTLLVSAGYFWDRTIKSGFKEGIILGILVLFTGIILDVAITIPLFIKDYLFLLRTDILIGYLTVLITTTIVGWVMKK